MKYSAKHHDGQIDICKYIHGQIYIGKNILFGLKYSEKHDDGHINMCWNMHSILRYSAMYDDRQKYCICKSIYSILRYSAKHDNGQIDICWNINFMRK